MNHREQLDEAADRLIQLSSSPNAWRIKIDGDYVRMRNGKSAWASIGGAKQSMKNDMDYALQQIRWDLESQGLTWSEREQKANAIYNQFLQDRVEFVKV